MEKGNVVSYEDFEIDETIRIYKEEEDILMSMKSLIKQDVAEEVKHFLVGNLLAKRQDNIFGKNQFYKDLRIIQDNHVCK